MAETETSYPVERNDNIGKLARLLIGDEDGVPDFTAAPLLFDALMEEGDRDAAFRLRTELANMAMFLFSDGEMDQRDRTRALRGMRSHLVGCLQPALLDFNSLALELDKFVARCSQKQEVKSGKVELQTVRVSVGQHARRGSRVQIDDEEYGMMVSDRYEDGTADVMPVEDDSMGYGEAGGMPMTNPGLFTRQASIARSLGARRAGQ